MNKTVPNTFAFVGSGPVNLLKAYLCAKAKPDAQILIFDSSDRLGGAWYSDQSPAGSEIECGCHIWSYCPDVYRYIRNELKIPLFPYNPNAVFVGGTMNLPYSLKNSIDTYKYLFKNLILLRWSRIVKMQHHPGMNFRLLGKHNLYPGSGSPELINALRGKLDLMPNVQIMLNCPVRQISVADQLMLVANEESIQVQELFITSVTEVESFSLNSEVFVPDSQQIDYIHFLFSLDKPLRKKISYWRLMNDPVVHRLTDISYQTDGRENLLLFGIKPSSYSSAGEAELEKSCIQLLEKYQLIDSKHKVSKVKTHVYPTFYINGEHRMRIAKLHPRLHLLHSTDLMHGLYYVLREHKLI